MNKKVFIITGSISLFVMVISSVLLLSKKAGSFAPFTSNDDCTPYNIFVSKGEEEYSAVVEWYTKEKCTGFIRYGRDMNKMENISLDSIGGNKGNFHKVVMDKLVSTERYYYLVVSGEQNYGSNGSPLYFTLEQL